MRILTKKEQARFDSLRERDNAGEATDEEKAETEQLSQKIIAAEEVYRAPVTARLTAEAEAAELRIRTLYFSKKRKARLAQKLEQEIGELKRELDTLHQEWYRLHGSKTAS